MLLLGAATTAPTATGAAPIWVAAIGALSLIAGALIPEVFKLLRPKAGEEPVALPPAVTAEAFRELSKKVDDIAVGQGSLRGEVGSMRHEMGVYRRVMEDRDRDRNRELEQVRDQMQEHRWREHGLPGGTQPIHGIPGPRTAPDLEIPPV